MAIEAKIISPPSAQFVEWKASTKHILGEAPNYLPNNIKPGRLDVCEGARQATLGDGLMHFLGIELANGKSVNLGLVQANEQSDGGLISVSGVNKGFIQLTEQVIFSYEDIIVEFNPASVCVANEKLAQ